MKTHRDVSFVLTEMTRFLFLFHFLRCHFLWAFRIPQWFAFLGGFNSSIAIPSSL